VTRILAISDEVADVLLNVERLREIEPDVVVSCGDLPFDYLEYVASVTEVPLAYVFGNHDPVDAKPEGCVPVDGRIADVSGLRIAGLGGSMRYSNGPHQFTEEQMRRRSRRLARRARFRKVRSGSAVDVLVTHSPPQGVGDESDRAHRGFHAFHRLVSVLSPKVMLHGHIHLYGQARVDRAIDDVPVLNAVGYRVVEVDA
jgi:Icc-related predicted phosphoesterase